MSRLSHIPIARSIQDQAAAWVARRDSDGLDVTADRDFTAWLDASAAHRAAFELHEALWRDLGSIPLAAPEEISTSAVHFGAGRMFRRKAFAAAAVVLLAICATFAGLRLPADNTYTTAVGEQRSVTLGDGSRITLNTDTHFTVQFDDHQRIVALERGEALFEVAHDTDRPFIVRSPLGSVRAVGTKFSVRVDGGANFEVVVAEGKVAVTESPKADGTILPGTNSPGSVYLAAGQVLNHTPKVKQADVTNLPPEAVAQALAWRQGDIVFNGNSLADAAREMQRYTDQRIVVDPAVAHFTVGGYFRTNDLNAFLQTVEGVFPVKAVRVGEEVKLVPRTP